MAEEPPTTAFELEQTIEIGERSRREDPIIFKRRFMTALLRGRCFERAFEQADFVQALGVEVVADRRDPLRRTAERLAR